MQIKNKLSNLILSTFLLLFVNKKMFTKCFFSAPKVLFFFFAKWVLFFFFFAKNVLFFPWKGAFFKCFFCQSPLRSLLLFLTQTEHTGVCSPSPEGKVTAGLWQFIVSTATYICVHVPFCEII